MPLLICRTCPRYDPRATGDFGRRLTAALAQIAENEPDVPVDVRNVQCLGGCPDHGVAAVDGPGKARVRFTGLAESDAKAVHAAALAHDACATGHPADWPVPPELASRISSITTKRQPATPPGQPARHPRAPGNPILIPNRPWATRIPQPPIPTRTQHPTAPRLPPVRQPRPSQ
jgi:predicted metal-binding protein